jgi:hypothetical protein
MEGAATLLRPALEIVNFSTSEDGLSSSSASAPAVAPDPFFAGRADVCIEMSEGPLGESWNKSRLALLLSLLMFWSFSSTPKLLADSLRASSTTSVVVSSDDRLSFFCLASENAPDPTIRTVPLEGFRFRPDPACSAGVGEGNVNFFATLAGDGDDAGGGSTGLNTRLGVKRFFDESDLD